MKIGMSVNDFGTSVSVHICDSCGSNFTVCPAIDDISKGWENCLGLECESYNNNRDIDKLFDSELNKTIYKNIVKKSAKLLPN